MLKYLILLILASTAHAAIVTTFTAPDSSYEVLEDFLNQSDEIFLATYIFNSPFVADLIDGKKAIIIVEKSPAGGVSDQQKAVLCDLVENGVDVFLYDGEATFHHAKYIISGDKILISSENFVIDGYPPNQKGNRGWGVVIEDAELADNLLQIFKEDLNKSERYECISDYNIGTYFINNSYEAKFEPKTFENQKVELFTAPEALFEVLRLIESAEESIYAEQFFIYRYWDKTGIPNMFLEESVEKAFEGLDVKFLLDSTSYNIDKNNTLSNFYTNLYINDLSIKDNIRLQSRLSTLDVDKIHTKGLIIDNKKVLISSINWNLNSPQNNREIGVIIEGEAAEYFTEVFLSDFNNGYETPTGNLLEGTNFILGLIVLTVILIILFKRRKKVVI